MARGTLRISRSLVVFATLLVAGCATPSPEEPDDGRYAGSGAEAALAAGDLVLYMTESTHSGRQGFHLAPPPSAGSSRPATCRALAEGAPAPGTSCTPADGLPIDYACDPQGEAERAPWTLRVSWQGAGQERRGWTVVAENEDGRTVAEWHGAELACAGHLTE